MCIRCNLLCDKSERTDQDFHKLVLREKCLLRKLTIKEQEIQDYAVSIWTYSVYKLYNSVIFFNFYTCVLQNYNFFDVPRSKFE